MALNGKEDLYGRQPMAFVQGNQHRQDYREPLSDLAGNHTPISIENQQYKRDLGFAQIGNDHMSQRKPMNYHYQQQMLRQGVAGSQSDYQPGYGDQRSKGQIVDNSNPLLGGSSSYQQPQLVQQRHQSVGHKTAIPDIRDRKMREREERIRREKEEMEHLTNQYPFGRQSQGGAGAPMRDVQGNVVSNRRPYSQVREPTTLHSSQSNQNFNYQGGQIPIQPQNLNQSVDITQNYANYYQGAQQQASKSPMSSQQVPAKITSYETVEQREQRFKKQSEYQDILKIQMMEKKQKEEEAKRRRMDEEMRQEQRIKEEIEKERQIQMQEKLKKEQQQNKFVNQHMNEPPQHQVRGRVKQQASPSQYSNKASDLTNDLDNSMFKGDSRRQLDMNQFTSSYSKQQQQQLPQLINNSNMLVFNNMESNFNSELHKLKNDMAMQQQQFETQLSQLRFEAQRNIDYRVKAEQELQRMKLNSQRDSVRPQSNGLNQVAQKDMGVRRSMAGINNYEKLFFAGGNQGQSIQGYTGIGMQPPMPIPISRQNQVSGYDQGLGGQFEGSLSLKAESAFVPLNQNPPMPYGQQDPTAYLNDFSLEQISIKPTSQQKKTADSTFDTDLGLHQLESAINEISEMNLGENYKHTQQVLQEARVDQPKPQQYQMPPNQKTPNIPEYRGLQADDDEMNGLAYQISQANMVQPKDNSDIKKEYLMRNIPLNPIEESSNEHTFPSMSKITELNMQN